jgi:hypothetical protein
VCHSPHDAVYLTRPGEVGCYFLGRPSMVWGLGKLEKIVPLIGRKRVIEDCYSRIALSTRVVSVEGALSFGALSFDTALSRGARKGKSMNEQRNVSGTIAPTERLYTSRRQCRMYPANNFLGNG